MADSGKNFWCGLDAKRLFFRGHMRYYNNVIFIYKTAKDWCRFSMGDGGLNRSGSHGSKANKNYLEQLSRNGYCVIENFWSGDKCLNAVFEVERILSKNEGLLHPSGVSDKRIFGAEKKSNLVKEFNEDSKLQSIASEYCKVPMSAAFTLAAKLPFSPGNNGSGEGWHRDAFWRQFKAIIYLTDVDEGNGPFQILCKSKSFLSVIFDGLSAGLKFRQSRFSEDEINRILFKRPSRLKTFIGRAGTLLLVDTSSIHRGKPIDVGCRYALTNYYYLVGGVDDEMLEKFQVIS